MKRTPFKPRTSELRRSPWRGDGQRAPRTPLGRSEQPIPRTTTLKARGKKGSLFPKRRCKPHRDWIKQQPCVLADQPGHVCRGPIDPCHVIPKSRGGYDIRGCYPGCRFNTHEVQHALQVAGFNARFGVDLGAVAVRLGNEWIAEFPDVAARYPGAVAPTEEMAA